MCGICVNEAGEANGGHPIDAENFLLEKLLSCSFGGLGCFRVFGGFRFG